MSQEETTLSAVSSAAFDLEFQGADVRNLGAGLKALARLMRASDPTQTDGLNDTPILHGLGYLVEALGDQFGAHGQEIENGACGVRATVRGARNTGAQVEHKNRPAERDSRAGKLD